MRGRFANLNTLNPNEVMRWSESVIYSHEQLERELAEQTAIARRETLAAQHYSWSAQRPSGQRSISALLPPCFGVSRMADNDKAVLVSFHRPMTDDELRTFHDALAERIKSESGEQVVFPSPPQDRFWPMVSSARAVVKADRSNSLTTELINELGDEVEACERASAPSSIAAQPEELKIVLSNCDAKRDHNYRLGADSFTITTREYAVLSALAQVSARGETAPVHSGYADDDELWGNTIDDYVNQRLELDAEEMVVGFEFYVDHVYCRSEKWRVKSGPTMSNPDEPTTVERVGVAPDEIASKP